MKNFYKLVKGAMLLAGVFSLQIDASAQGELTLDSRYSQTFSNLPGVDFSGPWVDNSTVVGWYAKINSANPGSIVGVGTQSSKLGGNTPSILVSYTNQAISAANRALGFRGRGATAHYGVRLVNTTDQVITTLGISFTIKNVYTDRNKAHVITMDYAVASTLVQKIESPVDPNVTWVPIQNTAPGQGNNFSSTLSGSNTFPNAVASGMRLEPGHEIFIRFVDVQPNSGESDVSIDDVFIGITETETSTPLPVELTDFYGSRVGDNVNLSWATASEFNNAYFEVEQSSDGKTFEKVGEKVQGNITTTVAQAYKTAVGARSNKTLYFRLKQVDFDGQFEYSKVIAIAPQVSNSVVASMEAYPNPVTRGELNLVSHQDFTGPASVTLYNSNGKVVIQKDVKVEPSQPISLDLVGQPSGLYIVQLKTAAGVSTTRVVKQ